LGTTSWANAVRIASGGALAHRLIVATAPTHDRSA